MKYLVALLLFFLPTSIARLLIWTNRYKIRRGCHVGFSLIVCDKLYLGQGTTIGNLNIISCCSFHSDNGWLTLTDVEEGHDTSLMASTFSDGRSAVVAGVVVILIVLCLALLQLKLKRRGED